MQWGSFGLCGGRDRKVERGAWAELVRDVTCARARGGAVLHSRAVRSDSAGGGSKLSGLFPAPRALTAM